MGQVATVTGIVGGLVLGLLFAFVFTSRIKKKHPGVNTYRVFGTAFLLSSLLVSVALFFWVLHAFSHGTP